MIYMINAWLSTGKDRAVSFISCAAVTALFLLISLNAPDLRAEDTSGQSTGLSAAVWEIAFTGKAATQLKSASIGDGAGTGAASAKTTLAGTGLEQLRTALYSKSIGHSGVISGAAGIKLTGTVTKNQLVTVALDSNISTGYRWEVAASDSSRFVQEGTSTFDARDGAIGSPMVQYINLRAVEDGAATVDFVYRRPFDPDEKAIAHVTVNAMVFPQTVDLSNPTSSVKSRSAGRSASSTTIPMVCTVPSIVVQPNLPAYFDWRDDQGGVTKVKDQKACGSCWAFSTVGALESSLRIKYGLAFDLSEQFLVSCNWQIDLETGESIDPWGCSGGWFAQNFHGISTNPASRLGTLQTIYGAVFESDFPYHSGDDTVDASLVACKTIKQHPFWIEDWVNYCGIRAASTGSVAVGLAVDGTRQATTDPTPVLTTDQIKQLVYTYGPVSATYCSGPAFQEYKGGVFGTCEKSVCSGDINHAVLIVGWNDVTSTWIIKNSWGKSWGESGFANVQWGLNSIGLDVSHVVNPSPNCAYTILPETTVPKTKSLKYNGGAITLSVTASAPICPAPRITDVDGVDFPATGNWVEISGTTWSGQKGTIRLKALKNWSSLTRNVGLRIGRVESGSNILSAGELYEIKQGGAPCTVKVTPTGQSFTNAGGTWGFAVTTNLSDCQWVAGNAFDYWLHASGSGTGYGEVAYTVDPNFTGVNRSAKITVTLDQNSKKAILTIKQSK